MAALPLALLAGWEALSRQDAANAYAFVPLSSIGRAAVELLGNGELLVNLFASLARTSGGLLFGVIAGLALGVLMALSKVADRLIGPLFHAIRQVPMLGWIPLIAMWFGNGEFSKVLIVSLAAFYPMVLNTYEGFTQVESATARWAGSSSCTPCSSSAMCCCRPRCRASPPACCTPWRSPG